MESARPLARILGLLRRSLPWIIGITTLVVILTRVPLAAFRGALGRGPHLLLATVDLSIVITTLMTDSIASWVGLIALRLRRPFAEVMVVRGATYVLALVNYALGQGGFGYYLHRTGVKPMRAVGATLFLIGTNLATLLLLSLVMSSARSDRLDATMQYMVLIGCVGYLIYLVVIAFAPTFLVRREMLAPLFDTGVRGHLSAMVGRVPHVAVLVLGGWLALRAWGIAVPLGVGLTVMPLVAIASSLPIAPAGLGTAQAVLVYFMGAYASGATADERGANILAFAMVHFVYSLLAWLVVGLACVPFARRVNASLAPAASLG